MSIPSIDDLQSPPPLYFLSPEMDAEERPVVKVGTDDVPRPFKQQSWCGAHGWGQQQPKVTSGEEPQRDLALDVLQKPNLIESPDTSVDVHGHSQRAAVRRFYLSAKTF